MHKTEESVNNIRRLLDAGLINEAIQQLDDILNTPSYTSSDELYYLRGNAYRKLGNWQMALNNYLEAIDLNPQSPAVHAREMLMNILEFYNKDMYNQ